MAIRGYMTEKYNRMTGAYACNRLVEEAARRGIELDILGIHDTQMTEAGLCNVGCALEHRDFLINRYKWGRLKDEMNALVDRSYNALAPFNRYVSKYEQVRRLHSEAFVMPRYRLGTARVPFEALAADLGAPIVAKGLESSMGLQIYLITCAQDLQQLIAQYGDDKEWLFEEYITTSVGRDLRIYSIRGEAVAGMQRISNGDFRANVALGASAEPYEITEDIRTIARDIYAQTGLDFVGIDLMFGEDRPYFCEINVMPGLEGIEQTTGVNVAGLVMETIQRDCQGE